MELVIALAIGAALLWAAVRCLGGSDKEGGVLAAIFLTVVAADIIGLL